MQSGPSPDLSDISKVFCAVDILRVLQAIPMQPGEKPIPLQYLFPFLLHLVIQSFQLHPETLRLAGSVETHNDGSCNFRAI